MSDATQTLTLRPPTVADGARMHALVRACPPLEVNSCYTYLLMAHHFSTTSALAEDREGLVGLVAGYRLPEDPEVLFVWQIGVHRRARGLGLGVRLLTHVIERPAFVPVRYLEATVAPANAASRRLFQGLAKMSAVPCRALPGFEARHFGGIPHDGETLFRLGPFRQAPQA